MMRDHHKGGQAFTLVETVIVVAIGAILMVALSYLILNFNAISSYEQLSATSSGSASTFLRELESLTLPADAVLAQHAFANATYTSTSTSLVLEIPSIDSSGNVIANTYDYAAFYVTGTNAYRLLEANALSARASGTKQLSSTVSALTFTYNATDFTQVNTVTVDIQTQAQTKQDMTYDHRHEQIRLRNL